MKERSIHQLNQVLVKSKPEWVKTMLYAANYINEWNSSCSHTYALGDVMLWKHNLLKTSQLRRNPYRPKP